MGIYKAARTLFTVAALLTATYASRAQSPQTATKMQTPTEDSAGAKCLQSRLYELFEANRKSVVKVYAKKNVSTKNAAGEEIYKTILDVGTGFIASKTGAVMTSSFVTMGADKLWIEYDGRLLDAESVGFDPITTVSIIKISGKFKVSELSVIAIDTSAEPVKPATVLVSISYEMGMSASPRMGLATGQNIEFGGRFLPTVYVRTNLLAPRGAMGGVVFSLDGKFAGMTVASLPEIGGSFILPAKAVAKMRDDIMICGEPIYSWFGLGAEDSVDPYTGRKVVVTLVAENAPAKKAGFKVGDEIIEVNSKKVSNNTELRSQTFFIRPEETAVFKVRRGGEIIKLELIAKRMSGDIIKAAKANIAPPQTNVAPTNVKSVSDDNSQILPAQKTK